MINNEGLLGHLHFQTNPQKIFCWSYSPLIVPIILHYITILWLLRLVCLYSLHPWLGKPPDVSPVVSGNRTTIKEVISQHGDLNSHGYTHKGNLNCTPKLRVEGASHIVYMEYSHLYMGLYGLCMDYGLCIDYSPAHPSTSITSNSPWQNILQVG